MRPHEAQRLPLGALRQPYDPGSSRLPQYADGSSCVLLLSGISPDVRVLNNSPTAPRLRIPMSCPMRCRSCRVCSTKCTCSSSATSACDWVSERDAKPLHALGEDAPRSGGKQCAYQLAEFNDAARNRRIDIACESRHAAADDRNASDDHARDGEVGQCPGDRASTAARSAGFSGRSSRPGGMPGAFAASARRCARSPRRDRARHRSCPPFRQTDRATRRRRRAPRPHPSALRVPAAPGRGVPRRANRAHDDEDPRRAWPRLSVLRGEGCLGV